jgi:VanZ family protein
MARALGLWGPVAAWMGVIFWFSAQAGLPGGFPGLPDWSTHGAAYAVLALLSCRALAAGTGRDLSPGRALAAIAIATLYGVTDEYHQSFVPPRQSEAADVAKDFAGGIAGTALWQALRARSVRRESI